MDHAYIEQHDIVAEYVAGRLPPADAQAFEAHFVDCPACVARLELEQALRDGLSEVYAGGPTRDRRPSSTRSWRRHLPLLAAAAALVLAVGSGIGYMQARRDAGEWRRRAS